MQFDRKYFVCVLMLVFTLSLPSNTKVSEFQIFTFKIENVGHATEEKKKTYAIRSQIFECVSLICHHNISFCQLTKTKEFHIF